MLLKINCSGGAQCHLVLNHCGDGVEGKHNCESQEAGREQDIAVELSVTTGNTRMKRCIMLKKAVPIVLVLTSLCIAQSPQKTEYSDADIEKLVSQLVSPNQPPEIEGTNAKYGKSFDRNAQKLVSKSWSELRNLSPRSFPFVFEHVDDRRYALTQDSGDLDKNYSVGFLCRDILVSSLQPDVWDHKEGGTSFRRRPTQPDYIAHYQLLNPESAKEWWKSRKDRSLRELQIEVLEWIIVEEKKSPETYKQAELTKLLEELRDLRASSEPRKLDFPFAK